MSARVLVVDDILPNVKLLEAKLSSEYFDVLTALNGQDALKLAEEKSPDIILLDIMMPGMDGFEVCERLKANPDTAHIPVVMVTALTDATDRVRGLEAGADDFLSKPLNDTALMARVRSLVRLKMTVDELRIREKTASQLGVISDGSAPVNEDPTDARILVVEDKTFESDKFLETLKQDNHHVVPVVGGEQAIAYAQQQDLDLITVSLNLEHEDGLRLISHLRSNERTRAVPILMVAMEEDMKRIARGLEIGAHDYILRPVDRNELLARARTQVRRRRYQDRLRQNYEDSLNMALTDTLTGLYNRRYLDAHLDKIITNISRTEKPIGILMMDIDHFKNVNDTYGHQAGDEVLVEFSDRIATRLRSFDLVARQGGEEFVAVLPDITPEIAMQVAERLRYSIAKEPFDITAPEGPISCSVSIGGAIISDHDISVENALKLADDCLYQAKEGGRNRTVFHGYGVVMPEMYAGDATADPKDRGNDVDESNDKSSGDSPAQPSLGSEPVQTDEPKLSQPHPNQTQTSHQAPNKDETPHQASSDSAAPANPQEQQPAFQLDDRPAQTKTGLEAPTAETSRSSESLSAPASDIEADNQTPPSPPSFALEPDEGPNPSHDNKNEKEKVGDSDAPPSSDSEGKPQDETSQPQSLDVPDNKASADKDRPTESLDSKDSDSEDKKDGDETPPKKGISKFF
tara:strand:- start:1311 stop:3377 length:2067 start_codon:yes stop_codon:yes gene_type:complete